MKKSIDLKKGVDFIGVTCVFYCHDGKGNLLMQKRSQNCRDEQGRWDCGSGSMEHGETFFEAVQREIKEEYCVTPKKIRFWGVSNVLRKNGKQQTHWIALLFTAEVNPKKAKIGELKKMDEVALFSLKKLPKPLHSMLLPHLRMVRKAGAKI